MPNALPTACRCGGKRIKGVCDRCGGPKHQRTTKQRGYGSDWKRLSKRIAKEQPLCVVCLMDGRYSATQHRHHIEKIKDAPHKRLDRDNVLSVCVRHNLALDAMYERDRTRYREWIEEIRKRAATMAVST